MSRNARIVTTGTGLGRNQKTTSEGFFDIVLFLDWTIGPDEADFIAANLRYFIEIDILSRKKFTPTDIRVYVFLYDPADYGHSVRHVQYETTIDADPYKRWMTERRKIHNELIHKSPRSDADVCDLTRKNTDMLADSLINDVGVPFVARSWIGTERTYGPYHVRQKPDGDLIYHAEVLNYEMAHMFKPFIIPHLVNPPLIERFFVRWNLWGEKLPKFIANVAPTLVARRRETQESSQNRIQSYRYNWYKDIWHDEVLSDAPEANYEILSFGYWISGFAQKLSALQADAAAPNSMRRERNESNTLTSFRNLLQSIVIDENGDPANPTATSAASLKAATARQKERDAARAAAANFRLKKQRERDADTETESRNTAECALINLLGTPIPQNRERARREAELLLSGDSDKYAGPRRLFALRDSDITATSFDEEYYEDSIDDTASMNTLEMVGGGGGDDSYASMDTLEMVGGGDDSYASMDTLGMVGGGDDSYVSMEDTMEMILRVPSAGYHSKTSLVSKSPIPLSFGTHSISPQGQLTLEYIFGYAELERELKGNQSQCVREEEGDEQDSDEFYDDGGYMDELYRNMAELRGTSEPSFVLRQDN